MADGEQPETVYLLVKVSTERQLTPDVTVDVFSKETKYDDMGEIVKA